MRSKPLIRLLIEISCCYFFIRRTIWKLLSTRVRKFRYPIDVMNRHGSMKLACANNCEYDFQEEIINEPKELTELVEVHAVEGSYDLL